MAKDIFHNTVKTALQKDSWTITHDPYRLRYGIADIYIDLVAEKEGRKIAVCKVRLIIYNPIEEIIRKQLEGQCRLQLELRSLCQMK